MPQSTAATALPVVAPARPPAPAISDELNAWLASDGEKTLSGLIDVFEEKAFALLFVLLLGVSALPLPTGGATHVFDVVAVIVAVQLVLGREHIWVPRRWENLKLAGPRQQRFLAGLLKVIRRLERISRPRARHLFDRRPAKIVFGMLVIGLTVAAFFAPPFSGLDTLPALGVVLLSVAVLLEDILIALAGIVLGVAGVVLEVTLGSAAVHGISSFL